MDSSLVENLGKIAGIGGIALGVFLLLFKEIIRKTIFRTLTKEHSYKAIRLILLLIWSVAISGILAWLYVNGKESSGRQSSDRSTPSQTENSSSGKTQSADPQLDNTKKESAVKEVSEASVKLDPGMTGITLHWNGANTVSWYLYDESGQKPWSSQGSFHWISNPGASDTEDAAPGNYVVKLSTDLAMSIDASTFSPIKVAVQAGYTTHITPPVGRITLHWKGSNAVSWYLFDESGQKARSPQGSFRWYCDPGKNSTQDVSPGTYMIKVDAVGYKPILVSVKDGEESNVVRP